MTDDQRSAAIAVLRVRRAELEERRAVLIAESRAFEANLTEIRAKFGNPYYFSHPEDPTDSIANYTGFKAHEPAMRIVVGMFDVNREIQAATEQLRVLGVSEQ